MKRRHCRAAAGKFAVAICCVWVIQQSCSELSVRPVEAGMVRDQIGREVSLPDHPQRVVGLAPSIIEIIFSLGREDRLQGATQYSNFPPAAAALPVVGPYTHPDIERIAALQPDLCIAIKDGNPQGLADRLEALQIPVYVVNPTNLEGVMSTIRDLGDLLDAKPRAEQLVAEMSARIERVKSRVAAIDKRPRVFFQIGIAPMVSVGAGALANELIAIAGGENVITAALPYPRISREQVLVAQPEVIIITSMTRGQDFEPVREEWKQLSNLPAARDQRIFILDSNLFDRPTYRLVEGLELLVRCLHPQLFEGP